MKTHDEILNSLNLASAPNGNYFKGEEVEIYEYHI